MAEQKDMELTSSHKYIYARNSSPNTSWQESSGSKEHRRDLQVTQGEEQAVEGGGAGRGKKNQACAPRRKL